VRAHVVATLTASSGRLRKATSGLPATVPVLQEAVKETS
jgi:hypothetical protein